MKGKFLLSAVVAIAGVFVTVGSANAATNTSNTPVSVICTSTGQECDQSYQAPATTSAQLALEFETAWNGCGSFSVAFYVDGALVHTSGVLAPFERTGAINVGPVPAGDHQLEVRATGVPGGCNTGTLTSWAGRFMVTTNDDPPPAPEPVPEPEPDPSPDPSDEPSPGPSDGASSPGSKAECKAGGWRTFSEPSFKNQGQCVNWVERQEKEAECAAKKAEHRGPKPHLKFEPNTKPAPVKHARHGGAWQ